MSDHCRSCGRPVLWAVTGNGRRMPIDPTPRADGNLVLDYGTPNRVHVDPHSSGPRHTSHFATCPHADQHRRKDTR